MTANNPCARKFGRSRGVVPLEGVAGEGFHCSSIKCPAFLTTNQTHFTSRVSFAVSNTLTVVSYLSTQVTVSRHWHCKVCVRTSYNVINANNGNIN